MVDLRGIFQEIDSALTSNADVIEGVNAVYEFVLDNDGTTETYQLVLDGENSYAAQGNEKEADCTLMMSGEDFKEMVEGNLNGTKAFMSGRLKIKGNMGLALKLQQILASYNKTM